MTDLNYAGCMDLLGSIIRQSMYDYIIWYPKIKYVKRRLMVLNKLSKKRVLTPPERNNRNRYKENIEVYKSAKFFIFHSAGLKSWLYGMELEDSINIELIRKICITESKTGHLSTTGFYYIRTSWEI